MGTSFSTSVSDSKSQSLQQLNKQKTTKGSELSGMTDWIASLHKELQPATMLTKRTGITKYVVEEESDEYQLWPHD